MSSTGDILGVTLNRDRLNQADAPSSFVADDDFDIALRNRGEPVHVHLRFGESLTTVTAVGTANHYVDGGETLSVPVSVAPVEEAVEGTLEVVTGHGAQGTDVAVTLEPPEEPVAVDESFASPPPASTESSASTAAPERPSSKSESERPVVVEGVRDRAPEAATLAVVAAALMAAVGAVAVGLAFDSFAVSLGVGAVLVAVVAALFLLIW